MWPKCYRNLQSMRFDSETITKIISFCISLKIEHYTNSVRATAFLKQMNFNFFFRLNYIGQLNIAVNLLKEVDVGNVRVLKNHSDSMNYM